MRDEAVQALAPIDADRFAADGPNIRRGQIWLIKQPAALRLATVDAGALAGADVVLYQRALAPLVSHGRYAEPLAADGEEDAVLLSPQALKLAAACACAGNGPAG